MDTQIGNISERASIEKRTKNHIRHWIYSL